MTADTPIIVTGAASGMGRMTAVRLANVGHPVGLVDRDGPGLEATREQIESAGGVAVACRADVASRAEMADAFSLARSSFGPCWGLAAAAGILEQEPILSLSEEHVARVISVNLVGVLNAVALASQDMVQRTDGGRMVLWASDAAIGGSPSCVVYGATKAAVISVARTAAVELAPYGITATAVLPGPIDTPMAAYLTDQERREMAAALPQGRLGEADEVAAVVEFLMSGAGSYISGTELLVDGAGIAAKGQPAPGPQASA